MVATFSIGTDQVIPADTQDGAGPCRPEMAIAA